MSIRRRRWCACLAATVAAAWLPAAAAATTTAPADAPGSLIAASPLRASLPGLRATGWRITYLTAARGRIAPSTAAVLVPQRVPRRPALVGMALGSQGLADACAPSRTLSSGGLVEAPLIAAVLAAGATVVVVDGVGLGSPGAATYTAAEVDGPALLDGVRAARRLVAASIDPRWPIGLLGYSVGGASVAMAAAVAPRVAPELPVRAAAAGAPPVDVEAYVQQGLRSGAEVAAISSLLGLRAAEPELPPAPLAARGQVVAAVARSSCILPAVGLMALLGPPRPALLVRRAPFKDPAWQAAAERQWPGALAPPPFPVLLFGGSRDEAVPLAGPRRLAQQWKAAGGWGVSLWTLPTDHVGGLLVGGPAAAVWLLDRLWHHHIDNNIT